MHPMDAINAQLTKSDIMKRRVRYEPSRPDMAGVGTVAGAYGGYKYGRKIGRKVASVGRKSVASTLGRKAAKGFSRTAGKVLRSKAAIPAAMLGGAAIGARILGGRNKVKRVKKLLERADDLLKRASATPRSKWHPKRPKAAVAGGVVGAYGGYRGAKAGLKRVVPRIVRALNRMKNVNRRARLLTALALGSGAAMGVGAGVGANVGARIAGGSKKLGKPRRRK